MYLHEGAVVGGCGKEFDVGTQVVAPLSAGLVGPTGHARLECHPIPHLEPLHPRPDLCDHPTRAFMKFRYC